MSIKKIPQETLHLGLLHRLVMRRQRRTLALLLWLPLLPQRLLEGGDARGWTPLHWAVALGETAMVRRLLERHANPNAADEYGRTPLHHAVQFGQEGMLALLRAKGGEERPDAAGVTPGELHRRVLTREVVGNK